MSNMFDKFAAERDVEQKKIESKAIGADDSKRVPVQLSMTAGEKKRLQLLAIDQGTTVSGLVRKWIDLHS